MSRLNVDEFSAACAAVVIGVGAFRRPGLRDLPAPHREAEELRDTLIDPLGCGLTPARVRCLTDEAATCTAILTAIEEAASACRPADLLILYFSGHGLKTEKDFYLCPFDTDMANIVETAVSGTAIGERLAGIAARGVFVVLDCCVSAGFAERAPDFFRQLRGSDFRILLSAAREDQLSWETSDGEGTVFSRAFIGILKGANAAGVRPGELSFSAILEAIDFELGAEFTRRPSLPVQQPVFAGVYGKDPLLFVNRRSILAGVTVDSARVTRAYLRKVIVRISLATLAITAFMLGTYVAWLDGHQYAIAEGDTILIHRGYPGLPWFGYPKLVRQIDRNPAELAATSPLAQGRPLVAPLGKPVTPLVFAALKPEFAALRFVSQGRIAEARLIVRAILAKARPPQGQPWQVTEPLLVASMILPEIAEPTDAPMLHALIVGADRLEIRTKALLALVAIRRAEGFAVARDDRDGERFEHLDVLAALKGPCDAGMLGYLQSRLDAPRASGNSGPVVEALLRLQCRPESKMLVSVARALPFGDAWDLGPIARISKSAPEPAFRFARAAGNDFDAERFTIALAAVGSLRCEEAQRASFDDPYIGARVVARACAGAHFSLVARDGDAELAIMVDRRQVTTAVFMPNKLGFFQSLSLIALVREAPVKNGEAMLKHLARHAADAGIRARAIDELARTGVRFGGGSYLRYGNNLTLVRSLGYWWGRSDPHGAARFFMDRLADQELLELEQILGTIPLTARELSRVHALMSGSKELQRRAVAILAMQETPARVAALLLDPRSAIASTAYQFCGYNSQLGEIISLVTKRDPDLGASVHGLLNRRIELAREVTAVPNDLRRWRATFLLANRRSALSSTGQILTPGIVLWLRMRFDVGGDTAL